MIASTVPNYKVRSMPGSAKTDYTPRGGCAEFIYAHDREVIVEGPSETGKTLAACWKMHLLAIKYPGFNAAIVRKTQRAIYGSVLQTFQRVIKGAPVEPYGGQKPEKYLYANGSTIWIGGMDDADKVLSSERDVIYANQAEELTADDWEKMTTRTTGRGAIIPYPQTIGDCNPAGSKHWIRERNKAKALRLIRTTHQDNPTLYDEHGNLTEQGKRTMATLDKLTGVRYKRLKLGIWASAEGAVYDTFDPATHVMRRDVCEMKQWYMAEDEGYTNPAVILLIGVDSDGRWHVFREFYERNKLQGEVVKQTMHYNDVVSRLIAVPEDKARKLAAEHHSVALIAVDEAAAGLIADLVDNGLPARGAKGRVLDGIQTLQDRLAIQGDGRPRLTFDPRCVSTINDFESYEWKPERDEPKKENDHAPDAVRYLANALGEQPSWYSFG